MAPAMAGMGAPADLRGATGVPDRTAGRTPAGSRSVDFHQAALGRKGQVLLLLRGMLGAAANQ